LHLVMAPRPCDTARQSKMKPTLNVGEGDHMLSFT
jgi:hypothetical protein